MAKADLNFEADAELNSARFQHVFWRYCRSVVVFQLTSSVCLTTAVNVDEKKLVFS